MFTLLSIQYFLYLLLSKTAETADPNLPFMEYLDNEHSVCIKWGFDIMQGNITIKFIVNTTGWIGFGLSHTGDMTGADLVMGGVGPAGNYFKDYYSTENTYPIVDQQQSYTLLSLNESEGETHMTFSRDLQTCDEQDIPILDQSIYVIYAYGLTDEIGFHLNLVGGKQLNLLNFGSRTNEVDGDDLNATMSQFYMYRDSHLSYLEMLTQRCNHTGNAATKCTSWIWNQASVLLVFFWIALY
ncbi:DBH-like monooxygenase protein 2 homolog isoform X2 [Corythoichthys intestinalis]|uniref:DBH-like monooxygenase protein 2 homolog isoform X2 n=1 Tax=Corythoichthys intestinalis TaxID=161448 RepID=UPI0025A629F2|nr:DBH-like monooxygenase protein 2 homolog isoform X2 [Corythoichthys intestinalis]XP_061806407.1 DBH-like monooxygenase protein 2 homolog [Nerophis lumbriciformis]